MNAPSEFLDYGPDAILMTGPRRPQLAPRGLRGARRLRGAEEDPRREDPAGAGHRRSEEVGAARPRRRGLSDRAQVELHAAAVHRARSTWSAIPTKASPARSRTATSCATTRTSLIEGMAIAAYAMGCARRLQLHPRRDLGRLRALRRSARGSARGGLPRQQHPRQRTSASICTTITATARTSAARKPRCSSRSRARRASRASSRRSRRATASTASRRRSTTPRRSPRCRGSSRNGGEAFLNLGRPNNGGTKIFSVSGDVARPGNYEVKLGTPFAKLLEMAGGMRDGRKLKAVHPGRLVDAGAARRRHDGDRHGLRLDRQGRLDAGLGRGDRHGRDALHGAARCCACRTSISRSRAASARRAAKAPAGCSAWSTASSTAQGRHEDLDLLNVGRRQHRRAARSARWATPRRCR